MLVVFGNISIFNEIFMMGHSLFIFSKWHYNSLNLRGQPFFYNFWFLTFYKDVIGDTYVKNEGCLDFTDTEVESMEGTL